MRTLACNCGLAGSGSRTSDSATSGACLELSGGQKTLGPEKRHIPPRLDVAVIPRRSPRRCRRWGGSPKSWFAHWSRAAALRRHSEGETEFCCMTQLSVAEEVRNEQSTQAGAPQDLRRSQRSYALITQGSGFAHQFVTSRRVGAPILISHHMSHISHLRIRSHFMKKTLAILLVAGALAAAGLSATAAVSASGSNSGNTPLPRRAGGRTPSSVGLVAGLRAGGRTPSRRPVRAGGRTPSRRPSGLVAGRQAAV